MQEDILTVQAEPVQPKFCIARAIVSMGLGISAVSEAFAGILYACNMALFLATGVSNITPYFYVGAGSVFAAVAVSFGIVAIVQANRFNALYHRQSKMAKAGKVLGIISLVVAVISMLAFGFFVRRLTAAPLYV